MRRRRTDPEGQCIPIGVGCGENDRQRCIACSDQRLRRRHRGLVGRRPIGDRERDLRGLRAQAVRHDLVQDAVAADEAGGRRVAQGRRRAGHGPVRRIVGQVVRDLVPLRIEGGQREVNRRVARRFQREVAGDRRIGIAVGRSEVGERQRARAGKVEGGELDARVARDPVIGSARA